MLKLFLHLFGLSWIGFAIYGGIIVWQERAELTIAHVTFGMFVSFVLSVTFQAMVDKKQKES